MIYCNEKMRQFSVIMFKNTLFHQVSVFGGLSLGSNHLLDPAGMDSLSFLKYSLLIELVQKISNSLISLGTDPLSLSLSSPII